LNSISFAFHLRVATRFEEETKKLCSFSYKVTGLFVLLLNAEFSLLFNANDELVQICERLDCMSHIPFGGIKLPNLLATTLDNGLGLACIGFDTLDLINQDDRFIVNCRKLITCSFLCICLISNAWF